MQKLVTVIMCQNAERFIGMCLESVKSSDAIVVCDGGSDDKTFSIINNFIPKFKGKGSIIHNEYNQADKGMNGKQRNFYLDYVKKNYPGWYCLCLDADEVLSDGAIKKLKEFINENGK